MGLFSSIVGDPKPTRLLIGNRVRRLVGNVLMEYKQEVFAAGNIGLYANFHVVFFCGKNDSTFIRTIAAVNPKVHLKKFLEKGLDTVSGDSLTLAILRQFEKQSSEYRCLDPMFEGVGDYVTATATVEFLEADKKRDAMAMVLQSEQTNDVALVLEMHSSAGEASQCAEQFRNARPTMRAQHYTRLK